MRRLAVCLLLLFAVGISACGTLMPCKRHPAIPLPPPPPRLPLRPS